MATNQRKIRTRVAYIYLRLSNEDKKQGESGSITNQRKILEDYCQKNGIAIAQEFVDDDYSGGNFKRPGFQAMIRALETENEADMVITKDLSRLGRDMSESSYYAERYFPERGIQYIAVYDNFDSEQDNLLAPFQFAINDVYLRDSSKKVKTALHAMMDHGEYCFRAPYGYKKDADDNHKLIPNEETAPVVQRIFHMAAQGYSTWRIAEALSNDGIYPPLKYRVLKIEGRRSGNADYMSDDWNNTTVKRILVNEVYLGHTALGRSKKVSPKSDTKRQLPREEWRVTLNTHEPLVTQEEFDMALKNLGKRRGTYEKTANVRRNEFAGLVYCSTCGAPLCSGGTVYKGEKNKYWYLTCLNIPKRSRHQCSGGARIKYDVLMEVIREELNELLAMTDEQKREIVRDAVKTFRENDIKATAEQKIKESEQRLNTIDQMTIRIYEDMCAGTLPKDRGRRLLDKYRDETEVLLSNIEDLSQKLKEAEDIEADYKRFFSLADEVDHVDVLTSEVLRMFIDKIVVEPKVYPEGTKVSARGKIPYQQTIHIYYRFIGEKPEIIQKQPA